MVKPILFNTEMVRAILEGRKTVTRRVVKQFVPEDARFGYTAFTPDGCISARGVFADGYGEKFYKLPYQPGDILWVRETWAPLYADDNSTEAVGYLYKTEPDCQTMEDYDRKYPDGKDWTWEGRWRPSIHMPKEAARIWLRVTDMRVERLRDISIIEAEKEGCENILRFDELWDRTIKPADRERYGWAANPFCWVISFERIGKDESMQ